MKVALISSPKKFSATLTEWFTGSRIYHVALVDEEHGHMYDQHLILRRRLWPHYDPAHVKLVETPVPVTSEYMERLLSTDDNTYGWIDYCLFAIRPVYHLFGKSTRNANGVICSEMVYNVLRDNGWAHEFAMVPSPADLERAIT